MHPHDTRECLSLARRLRSDDVLARLAQLFVERGPPTYLRSDKGPEFTATAVRDWLSRVGVTTLFIAPGSPWENGDVESFNDELRDECLNRERFDTLLEAQVLIGGWRRHALVLVHLDRGADPPSWGGPVLPRWPTGAARRPRVPLGARTRQRSRAQTSRTSGRGCPLGAPHRW